MAGEAKAEAAMKHLWEVDHPYYCNEGHESDSETWEEFVESVCNLDSDLNLVVRWDWFAASDEETGKDLPPPSDPSVRSEFLHVFFLAQRKGYIWSARIAVCRNDEPQIRAWLETKLAYLTNLWAPIATEARDGGE